MMLSQIKPRLKGEVLRDSSSRERYSVAECVYRILPVGVVLPACAEDVLEVLRLAREEGISITARGAGSAVAGVCGKKALFCLPGSEKGVTLAMDRLILPELGHLIQQLQTKR